MKTRLFTLALLLLSATAQSAPAGPMVHGAWVREAPPTAKVLAAYLELHNPTDTAHVLVSADSPAFRRIELHRTEEHNGMAKMVPAGHITVAPHGKVDFAPGNLHIMLIEPLKPLKAGDKVPLILHFADGSTLDVRAEVRRSAGPAHDHGAHMQHEGMQHDMHGDGMPMEHQHE